MRRQTVHLQNERRQAQDPVEELPHTLGAHKQATPHHWRLLASLAAAPATIQRLTTEADSPAMQQTASAVGTEDTQHVRKGLRRAGAGYVATSATPALPRCSVRLHRLQTCCTCQTARCSTNSIKSRVTRVTRRYKLHGSTASVLLCTPSTSSPKMPSCCWGACLLAFLLLLPSQPWGHACMLWPLHHHTTNTLPTFG